MLWTHRPNKHLMMLSWETSRMLDFRWASSFLSMWTRNKVEMLLTQFSHLKHTVTQNNHNRGGERIPIQTWNLTWQPNLMLLEPQLLSIKNNRNQLRTKTNRYNNNSINPLIKTNNNNWLRGKRLTSWSLSMARNTSRVTLCRCAWLMEISRVRWKRPWKTFIKLIKSSITSTKRRRLREAHIDLELSKNSRSTR